MGGRFRQSDVLQLEELTVLSIARQEDAEASRGAPQRRPSGALDGEIAFLFTSPRFLF